MKAAAARKCLVAVLDIGKTNARLALLDPRSGSEVWSTKRSNEIAATALLRELDIAGIERWLIGALSAAPEKELIAAIVPVAHGAAAVLLDESASVLAAPDYEDPRFEDVNAEYERVRDGFENTYSPSLPLGLNLGRQLFYLQERQPRLFSRVAHILLYPQFWAWRLSGVMAGEVTSLGCHSDLWRPERKSLSAVAWARGWAPLLAPTRFAGDTLGVLSPGIVAATGLDPACRVVCGIHDSNASYLQHLLNRRYEPFSIVSSGTWTVVMANRADLSALRAECDMLANVDVFGAPVCTARFMGGREYEAIARTTEPPTVAGLDAVMTRCSLVMPALAKGGPFAARPGTLLRADELRPPERAALATLYVALMTDLLIESLGAGGDILIDGPLAANPLYGPLLATWAPGKRVFAAGASGGCASAVCCLAGFPDVPAALVERLHPLELPVVSEYRHAWRESLDRTPALTSIK